MYRLVYRKSVLDKWLETTPRATKYTKLEISNLKSKGYKIVLEQWQHADGTWIG